MKFLTALILCVVLLIAPLASADGLDLNSANTGVIANSSSGENSASCPERLLAGTAPNQNRNNSVFSKLRNVWERTVPGATPQDGVH